MIASSDLSEEIQTRISTAIPDAEVIVRLASDRHYEVSVVSASFVDQSQVKQHQRVYATFTDLMTGDNAPVHAIDRMDTRTN